eukprot:sb/3470167/
MRSLFSLSFWTYVVNRFGSKWEEDVEWVLRELRKNWSPEWDEILAAMLQPVLRGNPDTSELYEAFWSFCRRVLGGHQNRDLIEDLFFNVGFPQIVKYADTLDCRSGPLLDKVLWDYHVKLTAYDFVHYEYDSYVDLTLDRLANLHLDGDCKVCGEQCRVNKYFLTSFQCLDLEAAARNVHRNCKFNHQLDKCLECEEGWARPDLGTIRDKA